MYVSADVLGLFPLKTEIPALIKNQIKPNKTKNGKQNS